MGTTAERRPAARRGTLCPYIHTRVTQKPGFQRSGTLQMRYLRAMSWLLSASWSAERFRAAVIIQWPLLALLRSDATLSDGCGQPATVMPCDRLAARAQLVSRASKRRAPRADTAASSLQVAPTVLYFLTADVASNVGSGASRPRASCNFTAQASVRRTHASYEIVTA